MSRYGASVVLLIAVTAALSGCAGTGGDGADGLASAPTLNSAQADPVAPLAAGTLARVADGPAARQRLAYVNVAGLRAAELPVPAGDVARAVLGAGAPRLGRLSADAEKTVVRVGRGTAIVRVAGTRPERSAITPVAQSAVQSCLGETLAQTILGPATMGRDAALGVGIATSGDRPAGIQLRVCGAPHLVREVHAMEDTLRARFAGDGADDGAAPVIEEREVGEREMVAGVVAADRLGAEELLELLAAGPELRRLAWR